jgi:hypothetical protein
MRFSSGKIIYTKCSLVQKPLVSYIRLTLFNKVSEYRNQKVLYFRNHERFLQDYEGQHIIRISKHLSSETLLSWLRRFETFHTYDLSRTDVIVSTVDYSHLHP